MTKYVCDICGTEVKHSTYPTYMTCDVNRVVCQCVQAGDYETQEVSVIDICPTCYKVVYDVMTSRRKSLMGRSA